MDRKELTEAEKKLLSMDIKKFTEFNLNGVKCVCKVLRIHDPDTMTIGFKYYSKFYKKNIRLSGLDAPELHSDRPLESKLCRMAREYLIGKYLNKLVKIHMKEMDKYGRILSDVYDFDTNECINKKLIELKFTRFYGGDLHKNPWTDEELNEGIKIAGGMNIVDPGK